MIARLVGTVGEVDGDDVVLDVNGVGYAVAVPLRNAQSLHDGDPCTLYVHTVVREDAFLLYGFVSREDRGVFRQLISVSQVGPAIGLAALGKLSGQALAVAIEANDLKALTAIGGVGKKTAERIVLELRGKMAVAPVAGTSGLAGAPGAAAAPRVVDDGFALALAQLGYKRSEIDLALERLVAEHGKEGLAQKPLGERITGALRVLSAAGRK